MAAFGSNLSINPYGKGVYPVVGGTLSAFWNSALQAGGSAASTSLDSMNTAIANNLIGTFFSNAASATNPLANDTLLLIPSELISVIVESENSYMNNQMSVSNVFNAKQAEFINDLLSGIKAVPVSSIGNATIPSTGTNTYTGYISNILDRVAQSGLSKDEKSPLYMTLMIAESAFQYWNNIVITPAGPFTAYFDGFGASTQFASAVNYANIPFWVEAAIEGCLLGYCNYSIMDGPKTQGNSMIAMMGSAAAINAGKVIFKWVPNGINPIKCC